MSNLNKGLFSSNTSEWSTPQWLFDELDKIYKFTLDVCTAPNNAKCADFFTKEQDGLAQDWAGHTCWMNPPYGRIIKKWIYKAWSTTMHTNSCDSKPTTIVCLLPARTDTSWFHYYIQGYADIKFLRGRLRFGDSKK